MKVTSLLSSLIGIWAILLPGSVAAEPSAPPHPTPLPVTLETDGATLQVVLAACDELAKQKNVTCTSDYVSNSKVLVKEGLQGYVVTFNHVPPRGFDDYLMVYVRKKPTQ